MTLSMPSLLAGPSAPVSPGHSPVSGIVRVPGGFLASLLQEGAIPEAGPLPTEVVTAARAPLDPLPAAIRPVLTGPAPTCLPDATSPAPQALMPEADVLPDTASPADLQAAPVGVPAEAAANPRPKAGPKGVAADPLPDRAAVEHKDGAPDAAIIPAAMPPCEPAPVPVAAPVAQGTSPGKDAAPQEYVRKPAAPAPVSGNGTQESAPSAPRAAVPAATLAAAPVPVLPDGATPTTSAAFAMAEPGAQAVALSSVPAAPVAMMDRADWPQTVVTATLAGLSPDGGTMTMEMSPEELGTLRITLTLEGDTASVQIETATPEAARLLNEAERQLSQDFARQGVTLTSHDAQTGRRGDTGTRAPDQPAPTGDEDPSSNPVVLLRPQGTINLIA